MNNKNLFSIHDFAKFARTTRDTLLHYDRFGLLSPVSRGENNYRYYSGSQLAVVNLIRTLQNLGMSLKEIKRYKNKRTPAHLHETLNKQIKRIDEKIDAWTRARKLLELLQTTINSHLDVDETAITVRFMPAEAIVLGEPNIYSRDKDDYDALPVFYRRCREKYPEMGLNYPVWGVFSEERIRRRDWVWPDRYYFYNPDGQDEKPAALYAVGYKRGGYGQSHDLYVRILDYIDKNGFEICGPAYEEYPLNEISVLDENNYLIRVMITIREKEKNRPQR